MPTKYEAAIYELHVCQNQLAELIEKYRKEKDALQLKIYNLEKEIERMPVSEAARLIGTEH